MSDHSRLSEADTCRLYVTPAITKEWDSRTQVAEQMRITDGRVVVLGRRAQRKRPKVADYVLSLAPNIPIAVVEAKKRSLSADSGMQQAIAYAQMLGVPFAYSTNGAEIVERDLLKGSERRLIEFPAPDDLRRRWAESHQLTDDVERVARTPYYHDSKRKPRYYQITAINDAVRSIANGRERVLLTLATGTGKSFVAFQICYRLWKARWNRQGAHRRPRILYLADRVVLIEQPKTGVFAPFGDALHVIRGSAVMSREMYFSTYQAIAEDETRPGLYREYKPDYFDLVVVDECHRGSARDDSKWREILDYFTGAAKLGMTATPLREDSRDTYEYFGNPLVQYSLGQGIEDGFLAPYKVRRVVTNVDATGWRPTDGQTDIHGNVIPDDEYVTKDFERTIVLPERTEATARYLTRYLRDTDPLAKTIVFCVDQDHALRMRHALVDLNQDLVKLYSDYCCRVTSDEGDLGRGHLSRFQDVDTSSPVILTTSDMLTTGVDAPTVQNIVLCRVIGSLSTFKQIVGRGTRLRTDCNKWYFNIVDFTGTATRNFADPDFDGFPASIVEDSIDADPAEAEESIPAGYNIDEDEDVDWDAGPIGQSDGKSSGPTRYIVEGVGVEIVADLVYELDANGSRLRTVSYTEYAGTSIRSLFRNIDALRSDWATDTYRSKVVSALQARGIDIAELARLSGHPDADGFDLLCHVAFNAPLRTRKQRAQALRGQRSDFWARYGPEARALLSAVLDQYAEHGAEELDFPEVLRIPSIARLGNLIELSEHFGGPAGLRTALTELQQALYAA